MHTYLEMLLHNDFFFQELDLGAIARSKRLTNGDRKKTAMSVPLRKNVHHATLQGVTTDHRDAKTISEDPDAAMTIFEDLDVGMMTSDVVTKTVVLVAQLMMKIVVRAVLLMKIVVLNVTIVVAHQGEMRIVIGVVDRQVVVLQVLNSIFSTKLMTSLTQ